MNRRYCGIGVYGAKTAANIGTLWRTAANLQAAFIFTIGHRYSKQASDTIKAYRHIPLWQFDSLEDFQIPYDSKLVGVELLEQAQRLPSFKHPDRAIYLLGAEDSGLPPKALDRCDQVVQIPSLYCLNVAVAGSIVLYDRMLKDS